MKMKNKDRKSPRPLKVGATSVDKTTRDSLRRLRRVPEATQQSPASALLTGRWSNRAGVNSGDARDDTKTATLDLSDGCVDLWAPVSTFEPLCRLLSSCVDF